MNVVFIVIVCPAYQGLPLRFQFLLDIPQADFSAHEELQTILEEFVDVGLSVKALVHDQLDLLVAKNPELLQPLLHGGDIGDVSRKLPVVEGHVGFLTEKKGQIDLRQSVIFLILTVFHQFQGLGIAEIDVVS